VAAATHRTLLIAAALWLAPLRSAWAVPPPVLDEAALDEAATTTAPVEGPRPAPDPADPDLGDPTEAAAPPPPTIDDEPHSGIEFAVPPPAASEPEPSQHDPLWGPPERHGEHGELDDLGRAPQSGNWLLVSGGYAVPLAAFGCGYYVWSLRKSAPPDTNLGAPITSIGIATAGVGIYAAITLSVGAYRNYKLQRWARRHRVVALPQGDGLIMGGVLALFSPIPLIPVGLGLTSPSTPLGIAILSTAIAASAIGGPVMLAIGGRRLHRYHQTGGWRRRSPSFVQRSSMSPSILPSRMGTTLGVAGQF
jgi:hypothetical protein